MSALNLLLLRGLLGPARRVLVPRAQIQSKPAREHIGVVEIFIRLSAFFIGFLVPPAWVLSHLESYKKRE